MIRNSLQRRSKAEFDATHGAGLLITSLSISLDSLGVGIALPGVGIPLLPLLITVSISTTTFTFIGLAFGARLGERYEHGAERHAAGAMLTADACRAIRDRATPLRRFLSWLFRPGMLRILPAMAKRQ